MNKLYPRSGLTPNAALAQGHVAERQLGRAAFIREKRLTEREVRALDLLAQFLQNKEIADELGVKAPVAEKILRKLFRKLGVRRRSEAIVMRRSLG